VATKERPTTHSLTYSLILLCVVFISSSLTTAEKMLTRSKLRDLTKININSWS